MVRKTKVQAPATAKPQKSKPPVIPEPEASFPKPDADDISNVKPFDDWDAPITQSRAPETPQKPKDPDGYITVVAARDDQWEPFQQIRLTQGRPTPVKDTDWIRCQLRAGVLQLR